MKSVLQTRGFTPFPQFLAERVYMREFTVGQPLPRDLARWQQTVDAMLVGVPANGPAYLMIDQSTVRQGHTQRRPGIHIDGYWSAGERSHRGNPPGHNGSWKGGGWSHCDFSKPEAIILASDVCSSQAFIGEYDGVVGEGGDCSHIDLSGTAAVELKANHVYAGNVTMLHESLPVKHNTIRTLVRINVPEWEPT